jgi:hypothetical protein
MEVWLSGKRLRLDPAKALGKGGEADVFDLGGGRALKVWKGPDHPDLDGDPPLQDEARRRIAEQQRKLPAFPSGLPDRVASPEERATDRSERTILAFTMPLVSGAEPLLRYGDRSFRQSGICDRVVVSLFRDLHRTIERLHRAEIVLGDFNDLNVLARGSEAHIVDADSFQFGPFLCHGYTERFVDPRLCDPAAPRPIPLHPHDRDSDWYAYAVMLFRTLLFVDPWGGIFRPRDPSLALPHPARPLRRISVFHPEVRLPKGAGRPDLLPDDVAQHFLDVFEKDRRGPFPLALVERLEPTRCSGCGERAYRPVCPRCHPATRPAAPSGPTRGTGEVVETVLLASKGIVLDARFENGRLLWLLWEDGRFRREDGSTLLEGDLDPRMRFRVLGSATFIGRDDRLVCLAPGKPPESIAADRSPDGTAFDVAEGRLFRIDGGTLLREGGAGASRIGDVLAGQSDFRVGPGFGFGFFRAGRLGSAFVFDARRGTLRDGVPLPPLPAELTGWRITLDERSAWLAWSGLRSGRSCAGVAVYGKEGHLEATVEGEPTAGSWLAALSGACAAGGALLVPAEGGLVRVEPRGGRIEPVREFPATEPFLGPSCRLVAGAQGLVVVDGGEIRLLQTK